MVALVDTWKMLRGAVEEDDLDDAFVVKAFNRFARHATAILMDPDGTKHTLYPKGTLVTLQIMPRGESSFIDLLGGFIIARRRKRMYTELDILSHDFWLKRRPVFKTYTAQTISTILQDLVTSYTPLVWDASLVDVQNDRTITREWKGELLDEAIAELSSMSEQEEYGARDDRKFFFRPRSITTSPRDFVDGEYVDAEFPESFVEEVNRVTLLYGEGVNAKKIVVQDLLAQEALQVAIGADDPVVLETVRHHPEIDNEEAARYKAQKILDAREGLLIGTLDSWSAYDVNPGDVTRVEVPEDDVDASFRVAELRYEMLSGKTLVKVAENREGVLDVLVHLSEEMTRIDMKGADLTGTLTEVVEIPQKYKITQTVTIYTQTVPANQFLFGDWKGGFGNPDIGGGLLGDQRGVKTQVVP